MNSRIKIPLAAAAAGLMAIGVACGSGSATRETTTAAANEVAAPVTLAGASAEAAPQSARPAEVKVGNKVGDRAPEYALNLVGGGTVTSDSLVSANRPVFLFFMAAW